MAIAALTTLSVTAGFLQLHSVKSKRIGLSLRSSVPSYGAPQPYQTPGADFHNGARPAETIPNPSFGDISRPDFQWHYGSPANYSTPVSYHTPVGYTSPRAYGPELGDAGAGFDDVKKAELDAAGGGNNDGGSSGGDGGGGRGDGDGDGEEAGKKLAGLSMSQKLTLAYALLVGVGGIMGFAKTGSSKSLLAGGGSAAILYYVFSNLPTKPIMSSIIGLGISGLLLFVMGSRFSETGKVFPAGVVSLYSLVMTGGYIHGIMRGH